LGALPGNAEDTLRAVDLLLHAGEIEAALDMRFRATRRPASISSSQLGSLVSRGLIANVMMPSI
jgi:hypothetical protein